MDDKATPTITLAELYENQNQHIDALVIYKNLFKENPTDELKSKIDELKFKIFQNNTMEYSPIIDKIFSEEEKRNFHILPHEQFKTYVESQVNLENEETYPEDLNETEEKVKTQNNQNTKLEKKAIGIFPEDTIEIPENDFTKVPDEPRQTEETLSTPDIDYIMKSEESIKKEETIEIPEIDLPEELNIPNQTEKNFKPSEINNTKENEEYIQTDKIPEIPIDEINSVEDDLSLENNDEILLEPGKPDTLFELDTNEEEIISIEDIIEKNKNLDENENEKDDSVDQPPENDIIISDTVKPETENKVLSLFTKLSHIRPDIVERVLKENVGVDTPLAEIKLSDLNYVVELLTISENVEKN